VALLLMGNAKIIAGHQLAVNTLQILRLFIFLESYTCSQPTG
jgi:hypothetical protein